MTKRLIIDTDMGVDDAHALLMAFADAEVEIQGITTVVGNVGLQQAVDNAGHVLDLANMDIPYYRGAQFPLISEPIPPSGLMGMDGLGDATQMLGSPQHQPEEEAGVLALIRMVKEAEKNGDFTLVALGPLTNLALALRMMPDFVERVPRLVIMGGTYKAMGNETWTAEFNFYSDPEAAKIVLEAGFKDLWILPWEVSVEQMLLWPEHEEFTALEGPRAEFYTNISKAPLKVLRDMFNLPGMPIPDQLAMAVALDPASVVDEEVYVLASVEVEGRYGRGMLAIDWNHTGGAPNAHIVTRVHKDVALKIMKSGLSD
jgi:inosine-uridine nucleoside N-ribohydrolase